MKLIRQFIQLAIPILILNSLGFSAYAGEINKASNFGDIKMFSTFLYAANGNIADGNRVVFDEIYSNAVDRYDAKKMTNPGENFGLSRDGYTLAVEARQPINNGDTLHYKMTNLQPQTYTVNIEVQFLQYTLPEAEWVDRFTGTRRIISLSANSSFPVVVTADPASRAANRFFVVFRAAAAVLPVKFSGINLQLLNNKSIETNWAVASEENIKEYQVERSKDGIVFESIASLAPQLNSNKVAQYSYRDFTAGNGAVYYRVAAYDLDGKKTYSPIKMINLSAVAATDNFYVVNPVQQKQLQLNFTEKMQGRISVNIFDLKGNLVQRNEVFVNNNMQRLQIPVSNLLAGRYLLNIQNGEEKQNSKIIIIQ